jgi:guanylate kinase
MGGNLIIVSAPSGTGKTTILKRVMRQVERLAFSVSHTTRSPRSGETDGRDYFFVSRDLFEQMIEDGAFLEWARVHDNYYGTATAPIKEKLDEGFDVVLDIDVQGADIVRRQSRLDCVDIFIAPPNRVELENRLRRRGTEDERSLDVRLANSIEEMAQSPNYRYLIVNDRLDEAVTVLTSIIYATRAEGRRALNGLPLTAMKS